jgi:murein DD-endopeptidase MepM/ murein hydrolase activator NlpD
VYPPARRFPWTLLHMLVVGLAVAASFATASLASDVERAELGRDSAVLALHQPLTSSESNAAFAALAPAYVPPPQAQVAANPIVVRGNLLPPPPCVDDPAHPTFCVYTVQPGDTLSGIAELYRLGGNEYLSAVEMLAQSNKPDVVSSDEIVPGQKLRLPKQTGIVHTVFSTRTLSEIVVLYGVSVEAVIDVPENGITVDGHIEVGQDILVPDPQQLPPAVTPELPPVPEPTEEQDVLEEEEAPEPVEPPPVDTPEPVETEEPIETEEPEPEETPDPVEDEEAGDEEEDEDGDQEPVIIVSDLGDRPAEPSIYGFVWPVWGPISSYFGPGHPLGIDVDLYDDPNSPVGAAKAGIVTFAGGNACCSYGLYVIVEHGDGTSTLYAHLAQIAVVQGQVVNTGQLLGFTGATGYATGNHLHFEVRIGDIVVDPLIFLPPPQ